MNSENGTQALLDEKVDDEEESDFFEKPLKHLLRDGVQSIVGHDDCNQFVTSIKNFLDISQLKNTDSTAAEADISSDDLSSLEDDDGESGDILAKLLRKQKRKREKDDENDEDLLALNIIKRPAIMDLNLLENGCVEECTEAIDKQNRDNCDERELPILNETVSTRTDYQSDSSFSISVIDDIKYAEKMDVRCSLFILDLETGDSDIVRWPLHESLTHLSARYSEKWRCNINEVRYFSSLCWNCDENKSPFELNFSLDEVNNVSVFKNVSESNNFIIIKFLMDEKRTTALKILKAQLFVEIKKEFASQNELRMEFIQFYFDNFPVSDTDTPQALDMEDGDCVDAYYRPIV